MEDTQSARPTAEEVESALLQDDELGKLYTTPEEKAWAARVLPILAAQANTLAEANKAKALEKEIQDLRAMYTERITEELDKFRKQLTPPSPEELGTLLNQEYIEFNVTIKEKGTPRQFVIRELPLAAETRVLKIVQATLGERIRDFARVDWTEGTTVVEKINRLVGFVPGVLESLADCCAICLDPFGDEKDVNGEWVRRHIGVNKLTAIIHAQMEVSRYRDFLSLAGRFIPQMKIT